MWGSEEEVGAHWWKGLGRAARSMKVQEGAMDGVLRVLGLSGFASLGPGPEQGAPRQTPIHSS